GSLTATPPPGWQPAPAVSRERARRAAQAAVAADEAYRAGDFGRARQLISQAAGLDPSRAGLWVTCHREIAAKQPVTQAAAGGRAAATGESRRPASPGRTAGPHEQALLGAGSPRRRPPAGNAPAAGARHARAGLAQHACARTGGTTRARAGGVRLMASREHA